MARALAVSVATALPAEGGVALAASPAVLANVNAPDAGKSFGEFPVDVWAFYRCFRDRWPEFIRRNFRNSTDAAAFFGVDDRTVRGWLEGTTAPRGQVVAYAVATMPDRAQHIVRVA